MRTLTVLGVLAAMALAGCGGKRIVTDDGPQEDLLSGRRFTGQPVRVFIAAKRAFEDLGIEQSSARPDEALSGVIRSTKPGEANVLVNLTFEGRGKSTVASIIIYNVKAGPAAKKKLEEDLFRAIDKRLKKFAGIE